MRFPPPLRERHRRDNVGGLEEENDKKTVVVVILEVFLSLSFTVVYCAEFCGVSCWNNNNVSVSRLLCTYVLGRQREKKAVVFRQKEHSISIPFVYAFAAREAKEDISLLFVAFFFESSASSQRSFWLKFILHTKKSAREALDTPPREAGIPSLARETHRLIIFARGFFGEEDKETEKQEVLSGNGTFQRVSNQKRLSVSDISSRGNICFLCAREDRERRDNRRSALRNTSRYQKRI